MRAPQSLNLKGFAGTPDPTIVSSLSDLGFRQNPQGSNTGVRAKISSDPIHVLARQDLADELDELTTQRHKIYTGSGHRCGVITYSSVVVVDCLLG